MSRRGKSVRHVTVADDTSVPLQPTNRSSTNAYYAIGVNVHMHAEGSVHYRDEAIDEIGELGVTIVRDSLQTERFSGALDVECARLRAMNEAYGIKMQLLVGVPYPYGGATTDPERAISFLKDPDRWAGLMARAEYPNEYIYNAAAPGSTGVEQMAIWGRTWYPMFKDDPVLGDAPFDGPAFVSLNDFFNWGLVSDHNEIADTLNIHHYFGTGVHPEDGAYGIPNRLYPYTDMGWVQPPNGRWIMTECGYHNALGMRWAAQPGVTETTQAYYVLRVMLESMRRGVDVVHWYQMYNLWVEPDPDLRNHMEWNYGLIAVEGEYDVPDASSFTYRKKPSYYALQNLITLLKDDVGGGVAPTQLRHQIRPLTEGVHSVLFGRKDGSFLLAMWRAVKKQALAEWSPEAGDPKPGGGVYADGDFDVESAKINNTFPGEELSPGTVPVEIRFGRSRPTRYAEPIDSATFTAWSPPDRIHTFDVGAHPTLVHIAA